MNLQYAPAPQPLHSPHSPAYLFDLNAQFQEPDEPQADEIRFRHLKTPQDIAHVLHLREELSLPAAIRDDPEFVAREKKEMKSDLLAPLYGGANLLGLSASFPSVRAWRLAGRSCSATKSILATQAGKSAGWCLHHSTGLGRNS